MVSIARENLKKLQKTIKANNYKIKYTDGECKYIEYNEIAFYNDRSQDAVTLVKRIRNIRVLHFLKYDLLKPDEHKLIEFLSRQKYECIICYESNDDGNENLTFKKCFGCNAYYCQCCLHRISKCSVCSLCYECYNTPFRCIGSDKLTDEQYKLYDTFHN